MLMVAWATSPSDVLYVRCTSTAGAPAPTRAPTNYPASDASTPPSIGTQVLQNTAGFDARVPGGQGEQVLGSSKHPLVLAARANPMKSQVSFARFIL